MRLVALCVPLLLLGCQQSGSAAPAPSTPTAAAPSAPAVGPAWTTAQEACVDRWLASHGLDAYGSPQGTMYPGGTPLFDEATGQRLSRLDYLAHHHPDVLQGCGLSKP